MEAVLLIGIQASGKTTFYRERFFDTHIRISLDMLRTRERERVLMNACWRRASRSWSTIKLMICDSPPFVEEKLKPAVEALEKYPDHQIGEQYLIFNCRCDRGVINCHSWRVIAKETDVQFSVMPGFPRVFNADISEKNKHQSDGHLGTIE